MCDFEREFIGICVALIEESIENLKDKNPKYKRIIQQKSSMSAQFNSIIFKFSRRNQKLFERYKDSIFYIRGAEQDWLYLQVYKDCIKILKLIGAL